MSSGTEPEGTFTFTYSSKIPNVTVSGGCASDEDHPGTVTCTGIGGFNSPVSNCSHPKPGLANLPLWITDNEWQNVMYYLISEDCTYSAPGCAEGHLTVRAKTNNHALVISAGSTLGTQARPSNLISDYLDGADNTNGDNVFDALGLSKGSTYNDQIFVVAP